MTLAVSGRTGQDECGEEVESEAILWFPGELGGGLVFLGADGVSAEICDPEEKPEDER